MLLNSKVYLILRFLRTFTANSPSACFGTGNSGLPTFGRLYFLALVMALWCLEINAIVICVIIDDLLSLTAIFSVGLGCKFFKLPI